MSQEWEEYPNCPCCGTIDQDWHDGLPPKKDGDRWKATCYNCGNDYYVELKATATSATFRTFLLLTETATFRTFLLLTETKEVKPKS